MSAKKYTYDDMREFAMRCNENIDNKIRTAITGRLLAGVASFVCFATAHAIIGGIALIANNPEAQICRLVSSVAVAMLILAGIGVGLYSLLGFDNSEQSYLR